MAKKTSKELGALAKAARALKARSNAAKAKRAEALLSLVARRKARIVEDFYDIGEALREILRDRLYEALGYPSFQRMLAARETISVTAAKRLIAVVERIPREQALRLGQEKSYALVAYAAATPEDDSPAELADADARIAGKPLSRASTRDVDAAARAVREKVRRETASPEQKAARARTARALAAVRARIASWKIGKVEVAARGGAIVITLAADQALRLER